MLLVQAEGMLIPVFCSKALVQFCRIYLACSLVAYLFIQLKKILMHANYFALEKQELEAPSQVKTTCIPVPTGIRKV